ncbi:probable cytochrome P450 CYP44 [Tigriopus californicus]|uniref:probable cytochrome P450 CYP44 n=1 Tax=Tigriopus californicus TaxID=6832 RepID=UPI0027DA37FB|nr:probable cytochrome P450 CYP44 [Tigriopus californicus]
MATQALARIPGPSTYPLIGNLYQYNNWVGPFNKFKYHEALQSLYRTYGPVVKQSIGGRVIVHVFEPSDIQCVYSQEGKWPLVPPLQETTQMYRQQKQMSLGLGNTNGAEWYRLRANSQQKMLRPKEVQFHLPVVNQIAQDLALRINRIRYTTSEVNDLRLEIGRWSLENAAALVFDHRLGCLASNTDDEEFGRQMVEANASIFKLSGLLKLSMPFYKYASTPKWRQLVRAEDFFYSKAIQLVDDALLRLKDAIEGATLREGQFHLLRYLLSREELSLKDVTVICLSLFSDGLSTTTPTLLFNLYALATNRPAQDKLYEEINSIVGKSEAVTEEHISKMVFLKAFVKETFRLWPNGTEVSRYTEEDMELSGYHIPAGTHVDLNPLVHFRDSRWFPNPSAHLPERWLRISEDRKDSNLVHPYLLTPFGHGTRMCAGRRFAEQDLYVVLATLLRRFILSYPVGEDMDQIYHTLLFPDRPVRVKFLDRSQSKSMNKDIK